MNQSSKMCGLKLFFVAMAMSVAGGATIAAADKVVLIAGGKDMPVKGPFAVAFDKAGNMYIGEYSGQHVKKIDAKGILSIIAGTGTKGAAGDGGPAVSCQFNCIHDVVVGPDDNLYIADSFNRRIRKMDLSTGIITTFAGIAEGKGVSGDGGPADKANLDGVASLWFSNDGATLYSSGFSKVVRAINMKTNVISTVEGLPGGRSIAMDSKGNLYVAGGKTLSVRTPDGKMRVLLDATHTGGAEPGLGDNPKHLGIDAQDNVLICDEQHNLVRKYQSADGKLVTIAGNGKPGTAGIGGPAALSQVSHPHGVLYYPVNGAIYISDSMNDRVLKFEP